MSTKTWVLSWPGSGFGNALIMAHLTVILCDNQVKAVFSNHLRTTGLVNVPLYDGREHADCVYYKGNPDLVRSTWFRRNAERPGLFIYLDDLGRRIGRRIEFLEDFHRFIPVIEKDMPVPAVDVAMCTKTGPWAPCRNWPHFDRLKELFDREGISYIDMNEKKIFNFNCLSTVKRAKIYLGLETGMSHYVSKVANGKALIIQGGFSPFYYWAAPYDYDCISQIVQCEHRPCFLDRKAMKLGISCPYNMACISKIEPEMVLDRVRRKYEAAVGN